MIKKTCLQKEKQVYILVYIALVSIYYPILMSAYYNIYFQSLAFNFKKLIHIIISRKEKNYEYFSLVFSLFSSVQLGSVAQLCPTLCHPMNRNTPDLPVHHQLPEFTQTHVHRVGDAIQPSHALLSPSPPALNLSQHQGLFQ